MLRFACFALLVSLAVGLQLKAHLKDHWSSFKSAHKKNYDAGEEQERKEIFKKNIEKILQHNLKSDMGEVDHHLGINEFADMSHEEFVKNFLGLRADLANITEARRHAHIEPVENRGNVPASLDWRTAGYVGPVKNQGSCGSCWSFATIGALESRYYQATGRKTVLSEQQLVDCSTDGNYGCDGGVPSYAMEYIKSNGVSLAQCYPYVTRAGTCNRAKICQGATLRDHRDIYGSEDQILSAVAGGPVTIGIDAGQDDFQMYRGGIYNPYYCDSQPNHAVLIVGYGTEGGQPYWLIKNSWGSSWGMGGFFKMIRNRNVCAITSMPSYPIV